MPPPSKPLADQAPSPEPLEQPKPEWAGTTPQRVQQMVDHARRRDPTVKFMLDKLEEVRSSCTCVWCQPKAGFNQRF